MVCSCRICFKLFYKYCFFRIYLFILKVRDIYIERSSISLFTPQMVVMVGKKAKARHFILVCHIGVRAPRSWVIFFVAFPGPQQGAGSELDQLGYELASILDNNVSESGLICYIKLQILLTPELFVALKNRMRCLLKKPQLKLAKNCAVGKYAFSSRKKNDQKN